MDFQISSYPEGLVALLTADPKCELGPGQPNEAVLQQLRALDLAAAFQPHTIVDLTMAAACHSALWLLHNFLHESHLISQDVSSPTGSFWHGIMHRREGEYSNAKYWFRRVGDHPVYALLAADAQSQLASHDDSRLSRLRGADWDPYVFVDLCEAVGRGGDVAVLETIARCEWNLLFDFSYKAAIKGLSES